MITIRPANLPEETTAIGDLLVEYMTWATTEFKAAVGIEAPTDPAGLRDTVPQYATPTSALLVAATATGDLAGTAALRTLAPGTVEIKRMYVRPAWRGQRLGSGLLDALLAQAAAMAASVIRLDTARFMRDAQGLYRSRGFTERAPYEGTEIPPDFQQHWIFFERTL